MRAGALPGAVMPYRFPQQVFIHRAEYFIGQFEGTYLFAAQIHYINRRHVFFQLSVVGSRLSNHNSNSDFRAIGRYQQN